MNPRPSVLETDALPTELLPFGFGNGQATNHFCKGSVLHDATTIQTNEATAVRQRRRAMGHDYQRVVMGDSPQ